MHIISSPNYFGAGLDCSLQCNATTPTISVICKLLFICSACAAPNNVVERHRSSRAFRVSENLGNRNAPSRRCGICWNSEFAKELQRHGSCELCWTFRRLLSPYLHYMHETRWIELMREAIITFWNHTRLEREHFLYNSWNIWGRGRRFNTSIVIVRKYLFLSEGLSSYWP